MINWPGLNLHRMESASRKYFRFHLALAIREEVRTLNAKWFGLELAFHYYPCWMERLNWPMGYVYDSLDFERRTNHENH